MATDIGSTPIRDDRISLRASSAEKALLARAAAYRRLDLTSFILQAALPVAHEVVVQAERISLSDRDAKRVLDALENPPKPTERLLRAARNKYAD